LGEGVEEKLGSLVWRDRGFRTIFEGNLALKEVVQKFSFRGEGREGKGREGKGRASEPKRKD